MLISPIASMVGEEFDQVNYLIVEIINYHTFQFSQGCLNKIVSILYIYVILFPHFLIMRF